MAADKKFRYCAGHFSHPIGDILHAYELRPVKRRKPMELNKTLTTDIGAAGTTSELAQPAGRGGPILNRDTVNRSSYPNGICDIEDERSIRALLIEIEAPRFRV